MQCTYLVPIHLASIWRLNPNLTVLNLSACSTRRDNNLKQLFDLVLQVCISQYICLRWAFIDFHRFDTRVELGGECVQDEDKIRVFVHVDEVTELEFLRMDETD